MKYLSHQTTDEHAEAMRELFRSELQSVAAPDVWMTPEETRKMLSLARTTFHEWEKDGVVQGSQIGGVIRYSRKKIQALMESHPRLVSRLKKAS